ncbi:MAG: RHS repeat domain-containing protein, partial [Acidobacteriota bacterium]
RTLASGAARQAKDLLQVFERDALGLTTDIKRYGGDRDPLSVTGEGCGDVPTEPVYWTRQTYQHGVLATRQPLYPNGAAGPFLTYDAEIDRATGLPTVQRDPAGFGTTFSFDALGRVTAIVPDEGAVTYVDYFPAGSGQPARAAASAVPAAGGATLSEYEIELDAYGRSRVERATLPGNAWTERITERNARGWATAVSQWGDTTRRTEFLDFDAFGRAHTIRPPDGAAHDVKLFYLGDRQITTETKIALDDGEAYVARINESDSYGRLRRVEEGSGEGGAMAATTYAYDVASRLTRIQSGEQNRLYLFDNRGFLLSEQHPEVGAGNGSVSYRSFDAAGLAHRMTDAARDLSYTYDFMGRPTKVRDLSKGKRLISSWEYDLGAGFGLGKVYRANHVNYLDAPWNNPGEEPLSVRHTYRYEGLGGALDSRDTHFFWSLPTVAFRSEYRYDELGNLDQLSYPRCISGNCLGTPAAAGPVVEAQYDQGLLTAIPGWADNISYDPSGAWAEVQRCNGVADHRVPDPDIAARPLRLFTTGVAPAVANFDSGPMAYDGAGNLTTTGADTYRYDEAERLTEASYADGSLQQLYGYDVYGNLAWRSTGGSTESFAIDPATNRLADGSYDAAGNLLHWGGQHFAYDVNNRLTRQAHMGYFYDADGERVGSYVNVPAFGPSLSLHLRDPA